MYYHRKDIRIIIYDFNRNTIWNIKKCGYNYDKMIKRGDLTWKNVFLFVIQIVEKTIKKP